MVELKETSERTIALQEVTAALSGAVTISDVARVFNDIAVKAVGAAAGGVVRLIPDDTLEVIEAANYAPETVQNWQKFSINAPAPLAQSVKNSAPMWLESPEHWRINFDAPSATGHSAWATLPLIVKDRTIGGLGFSFSDERAFSTDDRRFMVALANQYAQALDRTLIYTAEQKARNDAEKAKQRVEFLNRVSQLLASSLDFDTTFHNLRTLILPDIADIYAIDIVQPDTSVRRVAMDAANPEIADLVSELEKMSDPKMILNGATFRAGQAILYPVIPPSLFESIARDADHLAILQKLDVASEIIVPLRVRDNNIGILTLVRHKHHPAYTEDDVEMVKELAHRAAQALENARLYVESRQAINLRDEFLSVAAHELKTPVTSMRGFAQLLLRRTVRNTPTTPEDLKHALEQIDQQAIKLTRLIGHLLDVSRIESGRLVIEKEVMDLAQLVRETVKTMQRTTDAHTISMEAPLELSIFADTLRFEQVLINLLDNAVKFTPNGGSIQVQVTTPAPDSVTISVTDTGVGIPPERRSNLFDRFYQAHSEGYKGGMGLGLYVSSQIVSLHGGKIQPEFPEEGGTRFIITLPVK
jgi:K+-sensing histidine kinase KdpD